MILGLARKYLPQSIRSNLRRIFHSFIVWGIRRGAKQIREKQPQILKSVQDKEKINVIFLVIHDSVWKYEEIYKLLTHDPKFNVTIVIVPLVRENEPDMDVFNKTLNYFSNNVYNVLSSYNTEKEEWIDIKELTKPDLVFFTNPHRLTFDQYYFDNFSDKLTCYVPYAFVVIHSLEMHYNQKIHLGLWKHFVETKVHEAYSQEYVTFSPSNVTVTGYPGVDAIFSKNYKPSNPWKSYDKQAKKIIWAPHHTIRGEGVGLDYSSFEEYAFFFIELLNCSPDIQMAFKLTRC